MRYDGLKNPNRHEHDMMIDLMVLRCSISRHAPAVRERMKVFPTAWRDIRLLAHLVDKLQRQLLATMPPEREEYYVRLAKDATVKIELPGPVRSDRYIMISEKKLGALAEYAMLGECSLCLKEGREAQRCTLRQALLEVAPPEKLEEGPSWMTCCYRRVAMELESGADSVTI